MIEFLSFDEERCRSILSGEFRHIIDGFNKEETSIKVFEKIFSEYLDEIGQVCGRNVGIFSFPNQHIITARFPVEEFEYENEVQLGVDFFFNPNNQTEVEVGTALKRVAGQVYYFPIVLIDFLLIKYLEPLNKGLESPLIKMDPKNEFIICHIGGIEQIPRFVKDLRNSFILLKDKISKLLAAREFIMKVPLEFVTIFRGRYSNMLLEAAGYKLPVMRSIP